MGISRVAAITFGILALAPSLPCAFRIIWPPFSGNSGHLCGGRLAASPRGIYRFDAIPKT
jgi:hypothetical protein